MPHGPEQHPLPNEVSPRPNRTEPGYPHPAPAVPGREPDPVHPPQPSAQRRTEPPAIRAMIERMSRPTEYLVEAFDGWDGWTPDGDGKAA